MRGAVLCVLLAVVFVACDPPPLSADEGRNVAPRAPAVPPGAPDPPPDPPPWQPGAPPRPQPPPPVLPPPPVQPPLPPNGQYPPPPSGAGSSSGGGSNPPPGAPAAGPPPATPAGPSTVPPPPPSTIITPPSMPILAGITDVLVIPIAGASYDTLAANEDMQKVAEMGTLMSAMATTSAYAQATIIALLSGSTFNVNDNQPISVGEDSLFDLMDAAGVTYRIYAENYPGTCTASSTSLYSRFRNPGSIFSYISEDHCDLVVDGVRFLGDYVSEHRAMFAYYVPNTNDNGASSSVAYACQWVRLFITALSARKNSNSTLVIITTDASFSGDTQAYTIIIGPQVKADVTDSTVYNIYSLTKTIERVFGLGNLGRGDTDASIVSAIYGDITAAPPSAPPDAIVVGAPTGPLAPTSSVSSLTVAVAVTCSILALILIAVGVWYIRRKPTHSDDEPNEDGEPRRERLAGQDKSLETSNPDAAGPSSIPSSPTSPTSVASSAGLLPAASPATPPTARHTRPGSGQRQSKDQRQSKEQRRSHQSSQQPKPQPEAIANPAKPAPLVAPQTGASNGMARASSSKSVLMSGLMPDGRGGYTNAPKKDQFKEVKAGEKIMVKPPVKTPQVIVTEPSDESDQGPPRSPRFLAVPEKNYTKPKRQKAQSARAAAARAAAEQAQQRSRMDGSHMVAPAVNIAEPVIVNGGVVASPPKPGHAVSSPAGKASSASPPTKRASGGVASNGSGKAPLDNTMDSTLPTLDSTAPETDSLNNSGEYSDDSVMNDVAFVRATPHGAANGGGATNNANGNAVPVARVASNGSSNGFAPSANSLDEESDSERPDTPRGRI